MRNMSYCRFENTYNDLLDCQESMEEIPFKNLRETEKNYRLRLVSLCKEIVDDWYEDDN